MKRRFFLIGLGLAVAAPAIIRTPGLLMPIKPLRLKQFLPFASTIGDTGHELVVVNIGYTITRRAIDDTLYAVAFENRKLREDFAPTLEMHG